MSFSVFLQGLFPKFSELELVRARSFQIEKFNGVAPRPGGVAHLAKKFLPKRAEVLRFGACLFSRGPFSSLTEETSKELIFSFKARFFFFPSCPCQVRTTK